MVSTKENRMLSKWAIDMSDYFKRKRYEQLRKQSRLYHKWAQEDIVGTFLDDVVRYLEGEGSTIWHKTLSEDSVRIVWDWEDDILHNTFQFTLLVEPGDTVSLWSLGVKPEGATQEWAYTSMSLGSSSDFFEAYQSTNRAMEYYGGQAVEPQVEESLFDEPEVYNITPFGIVKEI